MYVVTGSRPGVEIEPADEMMEGHHKAAILERHNKKGDTPAIRAPRPLIITFHLPLPTELARFCRPSLGWGVVVSVSVSHLGVCQGRG